MAPVVTESVEVQEAEALRALAPLRDSPVAAATPVVPDPAVMVAQPEEVAQVRVAAQGARAARAAVGPPEQTEAQAQPVEQAQPVVRRAAAGFSMSVRAHPRSRRGPRAEHPPTVRAPSTSALSNPFPDAESGRLRQRATGTRIAVAGKCASR